MTESILLIYLGLGEFFCLIFEQFLSKSGRQDGVVVTPKTLLKIKQVYPTLQGNYAKIADQILENPAVLIQKRVAEVADACKCDNAQIIRFCKKLGFKGFLELKQAIAHDMIPLKTEISSDTVASEEGFARLIKDFRENYLYTINDTIGMVCENTVSAVVQLIQKAPCIMLCGQGASGIVADDFQMKLVRLGFPAIHHNDSVMNKMRCVTLKKSDVFIAISFSGENLEICSCLDIVKKNAVKVVAITNFPSSSIAKQADYVLTTAADETKFRIGAMTSRISQLLLVDLLVVMLALSDMDKTGLSLVKTLSSLQ